MDRTTSVEAMRAFNRFYTRHVGLLDERHLDSALSLAEVRLMYELAHGDASSPTTLARALGLDAGYVSRLVGSLERQGAIRRTKASTDARRSELALTPRGRKAVAALEAKTQAHLAALLDPLPASGRTRLIASMRTIRDALAPEPKDGSRVVLRDPRPGDLGWIIHRQAVLYAEEYGWDRTYEGLIATICGGFVERFDPTGERCWVAERDGEVIGSVFVVRKSKTVARLRLLYVEPSARGAGVGRMLVAACIAFARERGYRRITLWTNDVLVAARKLYQAEGFVLTKEERHVSFGKALVGQTWDLEL